MQLFKVLFSNRHSISLRILTIETVEARAVEEYEDSGLVKAA